MGTRDQEEAQESGGSGLYRSMFGSGKLKDRFGRDLQEKAKIDLEADQLKNLFESGSWGEIKTRLDALLKDHPDVPEYVAMQADYLLAMDKYADAEKTIRHLIKLDPKNNYARETLARTLAVQGRVDDARDEVYEVLKNNPRSQSAMHKLVVFGEMQNDPEKGIQEIRQMIANNPENGAAHAVLSEALLERGRSQEAVQVAMQGAKADPASPGNHRVLAIHYAVEGKREEFLEHARQWAQFESNPEYRAAAELNLLEALEQNKLGDEAYEIALRLETNDPDLKAKAEEIVSRHSKRKSR